MSMSESKLRQHPRTTILSELHAVLITFSNEDLDNFKHLMNTSLVVTEAICIRNRVELNKDKDKNNFD